MITFATVLLAACSFQGPSSEKAQGEPTEPPFSNDEPARYQTYIVQDTGGERVKFFVARDGDRWRIDSAYETPTRTASLHTDKDYILAFNESAYGEYETAHGFDERSNMVQEITRGMLNASDKAVYEIISSDGDLMRYRVTDPDGQEVVITFDKGKNIPVKKEIFSSQGGVRKLEAVISLEGFTTEVDEAHFIVPPGFKKVSMQEMKRILTGR